MNGFENSRPMKIKKVYTVFERRFAAGEHFDGEMHGFWECVCVLSGCACVSADDRVYTLKSGQAIFHKPMEFHRIWNDAGETLDFFVFTFSTDSAFAAGLEERVCSFSDEHKKSFENMFGLYLHFAKEELKEHGRRTEDASSAWLNDSVKMQLFCNAAESFLLSVCMDGSTADNRTKSEQTGLFRFLVRTMRQNIGNKLTVRELAAAAHTNETAVKRVFMKYCGLGPHEYFLNLKLHEACVLLEKGFRVSEISERLGFDNPNYFSVVFKRVMGYSPMRYKKLFLS